MDRLASMAAYVRTVELGSFAVAATTLGISPQMVAKQVAWLETRLGTRLINRTTRRQSITELGNIFYDRCKLVLSDLEWADSVSDEAKGAPRGRLRINAPVSFGTDSLPPVITRYLWTYPEVDVDLVLSDRFVDLIDDAFEAVFRTGPRADDGLASIELAPFRLVACAAPSYVAEKGAPSTPADLATHQCLGHSHASEPGIYPWRFTRGGLIEDVPVKPRLRANDAKALATAAIEGFGITFIAEDVVRVALNDGRLVRILPDYAPPSRPMHLLFRPDRRRTPKLRSFIEAIAAAFPVERVPDITRKTDAPIA